MMVMMLYLLYIIYSIPFATLDFQRNCLVNGRSGKKKHTQNVTVAGSLAKICIEYFIQETEASSQAKKSSLSSTHAIQWQYRTRKESYNVPPASSDPPYPYSLLPRNKKNGFKLLDDVQCK